MTDDLDFDEENGSFLPEDELEALLNAPVEVIVTNHVYHLLQLATVHLAAEPPHLAEAQLVIDAVGGLMDAVGTRLGQPSELMREALTQIRLAFVRASTGGAPIDD